jgi:carbonic anhydrase
MQFRPVLHGAPTIDPVDAFADLFAANAEYASGFALGGLVAPPSHHVAVVTCMDARIDPLAIFGLAPGDAHVLRNAGARVTDDVLRSLVKSVNQLEVTRIVVMHHNDCGAAKIRLHDLRAKVTEATGHDPADVDFHLIGDEDTALRADVEAVQDCPYLPVGIQVVGLLYDVTTGVAAPKLSTVVG